MKVLFIGLGSIGQRHLRNLQQLGTFDYVACRSRGRTLPDDLRATPLRLVANIDEAIAAEPDVAFLCAPPAVQQHALGRLVRETRCHLFVEKPIASSVDGLEDSVRLLESQGRTSMVGYNLRFHPVVAGVGHVLRGNVLGRVCSAHVSVGQYLPDWHPHEDYRAGYSANRALGGGVLLDLVHEMDLLYSWFGLPEVVKAVAGKVSALEIETEDTAEVLCRFAGGTVGSVHLDYVQRVPRRRGTIIGDEATLTYDLLQNEYQVVRPDADPVTHSHAAFVRNDMYVSELQAFLKAVERAEPCSPSLREGMDVLGIALRARHDAGLT